MRVKIIGSGSMWNEYNSASYMIDDNIIVDMPNGMCKYLFRQGINPKNINNVLITHFHGDHYFDVCFYMLLKTRADNKDVNIYCSRDGKRKLSSILKAAFPNDVKKIKSLINLKYYYHDEFYVENYLIKKYPVIHGKMRLANGYVFESDNFKVGFTGDSSLCLNVEKMASICDYLFCDCMFLEGTDSHMGVDNLKYLIKKYPNCKFIVSHMENVTRETLKKLNLKNVIVPDDGDEIEI